MCQCCGVHGVRLASCLLLTSKALFCDFTRPAVSRRGSRPSLSAADFTPNDWLRTPTDPTMLLSSTTMSSAAHAM